MKKLLFLLFFVPTITYAQNCNCSTNLQWLIKTFEENDAGFQYIIDQKGETAYILHNKSFLEKASETKDKEKCLQLLNDWTKFFRKSHLKVVPGDGQEGLTFKQPAPEAIRKQYENYPKYEISEQKFNRYLESKANKSELEGIWELPPYTIGIIKEKNKYIGFIMKSGNPYWQKNQIKLEILPNEKGGYTMTYYLQDHSPYKVSNVEVKDNFIVTEFIVLRKIKPKVKHQNKTLERFFKIMNADKPFLEKLSDNTIYLRIPSFSPLQKKDIDSLLQANNLLIKQTKYLIIDLRDNNGGSDNSYEKLLPYLYTNPIRVVGLAFLSTELNNRRMQDLINSPYANEELKEWAKKALAKLNKHLGEFVNIESEIISIIKYDTIFPYPKNIAILINENCASTTEQFLLAAKQSKKVKLFGTTTRGALDISNMNSVLSPCGDYKLWYGLSKSYRIPQMAIDGKGIQPDYFFDKTVKPYEWINHTREILEYEN